MKNTMMLIIIVTIIIAIGSFVFITAKPERSNVITGRAIDAGNAEIQKMTLSVKNYNYYPNTINLQYNVPAKIVVDTDKVRGCFQNIAIPEFNIRKLVRQGDNVISFIPNKKGTFSFSCSMGMGFGKIVVS